MMSLIRKSIPQKIGQKIGVKLCKKTTTISNHFPSGFMGLSVLFSDFAPVESEVATYDAQKAVHIALEQFCPPRKMFYPFWNFQWMPIRHMTGIVATASCPN